MPPSAIRSPWLLLAMALAAGCSRGGEGAGTRRDALISTLTLSASARDFERGDLVDVDPAADRMVRASSRADLGAWVDAGALPSPRSRAAVVAHAGFLYVVGGIAGGTVLDEVLFAAIRADRSLGTFVSLPKLPKPLYAHAAAVWGERIYVFGGCAEAYCTAASSEVLVASPFSDGFFSDWSFEAPLPAARFGLAATIADGFAYVTGGSVEEDPVAYSGDVWIAPVTRDGSLGAWATSPFPMPRGRREHASWTRGGRLYVAGGFDGSILQDVLVTPILDDGTTGAFRPLGDLPLPNCGMAAVVHGGRLHVMGGIDTSFESTAAAWSAPVGRGGELGRLAQTPDLPLALKWPAAVVHTGRLWVVGGYDTMAEIDRDAVLSAPFDASPRPGPFGETRPLSSSRSAPGVAAWGDRLFAVGGRGGVAERDVSGSTVDADGSVASWSPLSSMLASRAHHGLAANKGALFAVGGEDDIGPLRSVEFTVIQPAGDLGAWTAGPDLPTARTRLAVATWGPWVWAVGGRSAGVDLGEVLVARHLRADLLEPWTATTSLTTGRSGHCAVAHAGYLYVGGGSRGTLLNDVQAAPVLADGKLGSWTTIAALGAGRRGHACVAHDGFLYVVGGEVSAGTTATALRAPFRAGGLLGAWESLGDLPSGRTQVGAAVVSGQLAVIGGCTTAAWPCTAATSSVVAAPLPGPSMGGFAVASVLPGERSGPAAAATSSHLYVVGGIDLGGWPAESLVAPVSPGGPAGAFAAATALPAPIAGRDSASAFVFGGGLFVVGGHHWEGSVDEILRAPIGPVGTLGSFSLVGTLPTEVLQGSATEFGGVLYAIGGAPNGRSDAVRAAPLLSDGSVGVFSSGPSLSWPRSGHALAAYGGRLYTLGGADFDPAEDVQHASIGAAGALGSWSDTTGLPMGRTQHTAFALDGYLYSVGGVGLDAPFDEVLVAPVFSDGQIGDWMRAERLPAPRHGHASAMANGFLHVIGGTVAGGPVSDVLAAPLLVPAAEGTWSRLVDLGGLVTLRTIAWDGSPNRKGVVRVAYRTAQETGDFGPLTDAGAVSRGQGLPVNRDQVRWLWLRLILDDSLAAVADRDAAPERDVTEVRIVVEVPDAPDGGAPDGGSSDGGSSDAGAADSGAPDGGAADGGASDRGALDGSPTDAGPSGPPRIASQPNRLARCGYPYQYQLSGAPASAEGAEPIVWSAGEGAPPGFAVEAETGQISWLPTPQQAGLWHVELVATGPEGTDRQAWDVEVTCEGQTTLEVSACGCGSGGGGMPLAWALVAALAVLARRSGVNAGL